MWKPFPVSDDLKAAARRGRLVTTDGRQRSHKGSSKSFACVCKRQRETREQKASNCPTRTCISCAFRISLIMIRRANSPGQSSCQAFNQGTLSSTLAGCSKSSHVPVCCAGLMRTCHIKPPLWTLCFPEQREGHQAHSVSSKNQVQWSLAQNGAAFVSLPVDTSGQTQLFI